MVKNIRYYGLPDNPIIDKEKSSQITGYASIDKPWLKYYKSGVDSKNIPKKTIYRYIFDSNLDNMNSTAINYYGYKINFQTFFNRIDQAANSFYKLGVSEGDVVTICSPTFPETIIANIALSKIGAIANNIDPRTNAKRIEENINKVNSDYLIMLDVVYPKIDKLIKNTNVKKVICNSYLDSVPFFVKPFFKKSLVKKLNQKGIALPEIKSNDLYISWDEFIKLGKNCLSNEVSYKENMSVSMVLTGGTTGEPKSVVLTNDSVISLVEQYKETDLELERGQSLLNIMPEFIAYGWSFGVVMAPALGIENIVIPQFDQDEFPDYIKQYKPNHLVGVPTHYTTLMKDKRMNDVDFSGFLKSISAGGDCFLVESEKEFNDFLHSHGYDKNVIVGYGLTEANSSIATRLHKCNVSGSSGIPLPMNIISVFQFPENEFEKGTDKELKYGEYGEICLTGPTLMKEYYNEPEKTDGVFLKHSDGKTWIHTKDRGYMDENGNIFIEGRLKRMIIRPDGHNVWPLEMENIIKKHPAVDNCCVVGVPSLNSTQGEYPMAIVILKDEYNLSHNDIESQLRDLCLSYLPERDVPYGYTFSNEQLPLTGVGKIDFLKVQNDVKKRIKNKNE